MQDYGSIFGEFQKDALYLTELLRKKRDEALAAQIPVYDLRDIYRISENTDAMMGFHNKTQSITLDALERCANTTVAAVITPDVPDQNIPDTGFHAGWNSFWSENHTCASLLNDMKDTYLTRFLIHKHTLESLKFDSLGRYEENVKSLLNGNTDAETNHNKCLILKREFTNLTESVQHSLSLALSMIRAATLTRAVHFGQQLQAQKEEIKRIGQLNTRLVSSTCNWVVEAVLKQIEQHRTRVDASVEGLQRDLSLFHKVALQYHQVSDSINTTLTPVISMAVGFQHGQVTKELTAKTFLSPFLQKELNKYFDNNNKLEQLIHDLKEGLNNRLELIKSAHSDENKVQLHSFFAGYLHTVAKVFEINDTLLQQPLAELLSQSFATYSAHFYQLVEEIYGRWTKKIETLREDFSEPVTEVLHQIFHIQENMREYQAATEIDTDFFM